MSEEKKTHPEHKYSVTFVSKVGTIISYVNFLCGGHCLLRVITSSICGRVLFTQSSAQTQTCWINEVFASSFCRWLLVSFYMPNKLRMLTGTNAKKQPGPQKKTFNASNKTVVFKKLLGDAFCD